MDYADLGPAMSEAAVRDTAEKGLKMTAEAQVQHDCWVDEGAALNGAWPAAGGLQREALPQNVPASPYGAPISKEELLAYRARLFAKLDQVLLDKGNDYNAAQQNAGDTLFNLRIAAIMGIVPSPEQGILVRLGDKFMRLASLLSAGVTQKVKDESVEDTIGDAINYLTYIAAMRMKKVGKL